VQGSPISPGAMGPVPHQRRHGRGRPEGPPPVQSAPSEMEAALLRAVHRERRHGSPARHSVVVSGAELTVQPIGNTAVRRESSSMEASSLPQLDPHQKWQRIVDWVSHDSTPGLSAPMPGSSGSCGADTLPEEERSIDSVLLDLEIEKAKAKLVSVTKQSTFASEQSLSGSRNMLVAVQLSSIFLIRWCWRFIISWNEAAYIVYCHLWGWTSKANTSFLVKHRGHLCSGEPASVGEFVA